MKNTTKALGVLIVAPVAVGIILRSTTDIKISEPFLWVWDRVKEVGLSLVHPVELPLFVILILIF